MIIYEVIFLMGLFSGIWATSIWFNKKRIGYLRIAKIMEEPNPYLYLDLDVHPDHLKEGTVVLLEIKQGPTV